MQVIDILMSADLFAGDPHMEGNDMAGPAGGPGGPNRWPPAGPDAAFQGQPMQQQVGRHAHIIIVMQLQQAEITAIIIQCKSLALL